jgi:hypothetical protein
MRLNPRQRAAHALFKTYIDIVHVDKVEGDKLFKQRTGAEVRGGAQWFVTGCMCSVIGDAVVLSQLPLLNLLPTLIWVSAGGNMSGLHTITLQAWSVLPCVNLRAVWLLAATASATARHNSHFWAHCHRAVCGHGLKVCTGL